MARALIVVLGVVVAVLAIGGPARADDAAQAQVQAIDHQLERGQKLFDEQEYAAAVQALAPVTRDVRATRAQRLRALELIALADFIRGDQPGARATFERVLDIDPGYQLRDTSGSPKVRAFFDKLKAQLVPGYDPNAGAELEHAAPTAGTAGRALEIEVRVTRGSVADVRLATRHRGELSYRSETFAPRGGDRWHARVVPEPSSKPYVLEYYVEARDAAGAPLGRIAAPDQPLEIALAPGDAPVARPWYTRWYVIAGAAVAAASVTGIAIEASRGPGPGTLPPGSVTVSH